MLGNLVPGYLFWAVLGVGSAAIVAAAALAARPVRSAVWQRAIWQTAAIGLVVLIVLEPLGAGDVLVGLLRAGLAGTPRRPAAAEFSGPAIQAGPLAAAKEPSTGTSPLGEAVLVPSGEAVLVPSVVIEPDAAADRPGVVAEAGPGMPPIEIAAPGAGVAWLGALWAAGAALVLLSIVRARLLLSRFRRAETRVDPAPLRRQIADLAQRLGIRRPVCLLAAPGLKVPVAFGLLRPTLVVPVSFGEDFDRRQQEAILAHELAHLAAGDPVWQLLADLLSAMFWWQPMVWWLRSRLRAASEAAADEASLLVPGGPDVLADCLVRLGRQLVNSRRLGWLSIEGSGFRSGLGRRVQRLLSLQASQCRPPAPVRLTIARVALVLALVVVSVLSTAWARPQAPLSERESTMSLIRNSWQRSLAAVALAAWLGPANPAAADEEKPAPAKAPVARAQYDDIFVPADPKVMDLLKRRGELEGRTREIERILGELPDAKENEARELFNELRKTQREIREITPQLPPQFRAGIPTAARKAGFMSGPMMGMSGPMMGGGGMAPGGSGAIAMPRREPMLPPLSPGERERLQKRAEELRQTVGRIARDEDRAEAMGELQQIENMLTGRPELEARFMVQTAVPPLDPKERERRMKHVQAAADSLRQAGMPEQADRLVREAEAAFSGRQQVIARVPMNAMSPGAMPGGMGMGPPPDPFTGELRNQLRDLQRQIEELRQQLQAMKGPIERDPFDQPKPESPKPAEPPKPDNPPRR